MKKKFTEAQIVFALRQAESGTPICLAPDPSALMTQMPPVDPWI
jgi:hypothetical protein